MATISRDVLAVLQQLTCDGKAATLPSKLERPLYLKVDKVLKALGGSWDRKAAAHLFPEDAALLLADVISTGRYVDPKKEFQFYETPPTVADAMVAWACLTPSPGMRVLEPSAGKGRLLQALGRIGIQPDTITCVEPQANLARDILSVTTGLKAANVTLLQQDFLTLTATPTFDRVLMNPPFTRGQDMKHVRHAYDFLAPAGILIAIMSNGVTFRQDRAAKDFIAWFEGAGGLWRALPPNTFKMSGTQVNTIMVKLTKKEVG